MDALPDRPETPTPATTTEECSTRSSLHYYLSARRQKMSREYFDNQRVDVSDRVT